MFYYCKRNTCSWGFPGGAVVNSLSADAGDARDVSSTLGSGGSPGEENGNSLQYSCMENPMDRGAWQATVRGIARVGHDLALPFFSFFKRETDSSF